MKVMKRTVSFALAALMVFMMIAACAVTSYAAKADITINNVNNSGAEGVTAVFTPAFGETMAGSSETLASDLKWWAIAVFEADEASGGYKCTAVNFEMNVDKYQTAIPSNGFVVAHNTGNNWPELYASDPVTYAAYKDAPNYVTDANNAAGTALKALAVGDIVYLSGIDLENSEIDDNSTEELLWYMEGYSSNAKLTFTKPSGEPGDESSAESSEAEPSDEPSDEPSGDSEPADESKTESSAPDTGDAGVIALVVMAAIASAAAVTVIRRR